MRDYTSSSFLWNLECFLILLVSLSCTVLLYTRIRNIVLPVKRLIPLVCIVIILPIVAVICGINSNVYIRLIYLLCVVFVLLFLVEHHKKTLSYIPIAIIAISITYLLEYISVIVSGTLLYLVGYIRDNFISAFFSSIIQLTLTVLLTKIKYVKKMFSALEKENNIGVGLLISSLSLFIYISLAFDPEASDYYKSIFIACIPLALVGLILWIRSIVERYYKRKIADRADQYTQQEIADKDAYIQQLETEVATLAKQLHRDNHLLSSLDRSAQMLVTTDSAQEREKLVDEIHTLYRERNDMITKDQQANKLLPSTGISLIDGALSDMYVKATAHGISFDLIVGEPIHYLVNNIISQTDLQTLLCDHIKDAIIAIDAADITNGKILVTIEKNEGIFEISIRDNGVDFELDTLAKLGIERITTHTDNGGSGIGFMTTFETLAKTKGSLIITEYKNKTPFSKAVTFSFDGLHRFIISSYRKEKLKEKISRDDIIYL